MDMYMDMLYTHLGSLDFIKPNDLKFTNYGEIISMLATIYTNKKILLYFIHSFLCLIHLL